MTRSLATVASIASICSRRAATSPSKFASRSFFVCSSAVERLTWVFSRVDCVDASALLSPSIFSSVADALLLRTVMSAIASVRSCVMRERADWVDRASSATVSSNAFKEVSVLFSLFDSSESFLTRSSISASRLLWTASSEPLTVPRSF